MELGKQGSRCWRYWRGSESLESYEREEVTERECRCSQKRGFSTSSLAMLLVIVCMGC